MKLLSPSRRYPYSAGVTLILLFLAILAFRTSPLHEVPKTWDVEAIKKSHLPPPVAVQVEYPSEDYYNALQEHVIYKTFPVYVKGAEPPGYLDSLRQLEPEVAFDVSTIETQEDWVRAGEQVFQWPANIVPDGGFFGTHLDSAYIAGSRDPIAKDGVYPFGRYVIMEKGKVQYGDLSCATCHSRVMADGEVLLGAQGNHAFDSGFGYLARKFDFPLEVIARDDYQLCGVPWYPEAKQLVTSLDREQYIADLMAVPIGVMSRQGMHFRVPLSVPSLIGIQDIKYLDHTGLMRHEKPADLMRYAALNQGMDMLINYDGFIPLGVNDYSEIPEPDEWDSPFDYDPKRYTDAQLYALTQFIYALEPPGNPHAYPQAVVKHGERIFIEEGCVTCHTPPLYTNNMLTPVDGFEPPEEHYATFDIFNVSVETDPRSSLYSRRGTGYYKIPSLRGLWYKGPFFHHGQLATLEDVFDPARLRDDYVPTGYKRSGVASQAVKGHDFGMDLATVDKEALIAFLKTL